VIVVKVGGSEGVDIESVCADLAEQIRGGETAVLVHGGSYESTDIAERLGHPPRFVTSVSGHSSRYTDRETMEILAMVMGGRINALLVERLQGLGVNALGLSGVDGRLLEAVRKPALRIVENGKRMVLRGEYSGRIDRVNAGLLTSLLDDGYTPVVAPFAISADHELLNVDGDRAAAAIGGALGAEAVVLLTNVPGLLRDLDDPASLIPAVPVADIETVLEQVAKGRMKRKVLGAAEAVRAGVGRAILADGRRERPLQRALAGEGTVVS
jgi:acetylglutamate/LysW-gamma-L-alpha-aminoadipate kinase